MKTKTNTKDYLTPKYIAKFLGISYRFVLSLLQAKEIKGTKVKGKWQIAPKEFEAFKEKNRRAIDKLKAEYVVLYEQGLTPAQLEARVSDDFSRRSIIADKYVFATNAIMEKVPKRGDRHEEN